MQDETPVHFFKSEEIFEKAAEVFREEVLVLSKLFPNSDIQHVGSCSIQGAYGKYDVDIQIRVSGEDFEKFREVMISKYHPRHIELWDDAYAIFSNDGEPKIDYILTVAGSHRDHYFRVRDYMKANPKMLKQYNELKFGFEGKPYGEYREKKTEFIENIIRILPEW